MIELLLSGSGFQRTRLMVKYFWKIKRSFFLAPINLLDEKLFQPIAAYRLKVAAT
ncbi:hypothetical protein [Bacillus smithii]|uniref:hypothetical protein n=1 Tax=Bacillus smithii TaxID=1479 RepID=UPI0022E4FBED|nr:hypothetical protein [Bacillus smithii]